VSTLATNTVRTRIDIREGHRQLYVEKRILHRDLSDSNLMVFQRRDGNFSGILNDFDLATELSSNYTPSPQTAKHRTGTPAFMSVELLKRNATSDAVSHRYCHDLESFAYILIWIILGYSSGAVKNDVITDWRGSDWDHIGTAKKEFVAEFEGSLTIQKHTISAHAESKRFALHLKHLIGAGYLAQNNAASQIDPSDDLKYTGARLHAELTKTVTWEAFATKLDVPKELIASLKEPDDSQTPEQIMAEHGWKLLPSGKVVDIVESES
jgi:serine/threonine protein kinase